RIGDKLWIIAKGRLSVLAPEEKRLLTSSETPSPVHTALLNGESALLASDDGIWSISSLKENGLDFEHELESEEPILDLDRRGDDLICLLPRHVALLRGGRLEILAELPPFKSGTVLKVHPKTGEIWVGTDRGLGCLSDGGWRWYTYAGSGLPQNHVRDIQIDSFGLLWIATREAPTAFNGKDGWFPLWLNVRIPYGDARCIALGGKGEIWIGTDRGVVKLHEGIWRLYCGRRWLPGDVVQAMTWDGEDGVWVATEAGLAHLHIRMMTLQEKAEHIEGIRAARHNRNGWVSHCEFPQPADFENFIHEVSDNDGLWTGVYLAAESFRWAVTKDEEARRYLKRSLRALAFLEEVTPIPGFVARAARRVDEPRSRKSGGEWHLSEDGKWEWKGDTSSDEIVGHFFGYSVCWDLAADEEDKSLIREKIAKITDHIIENGFVLRDVDGERTQWGVWSPELLNGDEYWRYGRGLNSLEILSHLKTAYHITGEDRYDEIYKHLAFDEHYALNLIEQLIADPAYRVYHDNQLAFLSYYPLLLYEDDPELRRLYLLSLERTWRFVRDDRSPLWNIIYGILTGRPCDLEEAVRTLREIPLDMVRWNVDNSFRWDLPPHPVRPGESNVPVPPGERDVVNWDGNPYKLRGGTGGRTENDGAFFLLPYWMGRYHGLIRG
ncbi:TPA: hypothetical protein EYP37_12700, partial [Candidatus Poribacteria bacterium]|nr:hypothetical protein [Candidatus Poribacteria bacterium]